MCETMMKDSPLTRRQLINRNEINAHILHLDSEHLMFQLHQMCVRK